VDARQVELGMYKEVMDQIGKPVVFNICVLGAMVGLVPIVKIESIMKVIETKIPAGFLDMNKKALGLGFHLVEASPFKQKGH
jgi:2-oxoglutarate ferredoxin oxidoreductase subunit gamma